MVAKAKAIKPTEIDTRSSSDSLDQLSELRKTVYDAVTRTGEVMHSLQKSLRKHGAAMAVGATADAESRGLEYKVRLFEQPDMLSSEEMARRLSFGSKASLTARKKAHELLALPHPTRKNQLGYPAWQLDDGVFEPLPRVLEALRGLDPWSQWYFFLTEDAHLAGLRPIDMLRLHPRDMDEVQQARRKRLLSKRDRVDLVVEAAQAYADEH